VGDQKREPLEPGQGVPEAEDQLRRRVSEARTSISEMVREAVERLEHQERAALRAAEERLGMIAAERIDDALIRLGTEKGQLRGEVERRLEGAIERLASEVGRRMAAARVELEQLAGRAAPAAVDSGAGRESLERAGEDALEAVLEAESRAVRRLSEAQQRLEALEQRAAMIEGRMTEAAATAARAADWETRIEAATRTEAEAARRIEDAERRLLGRAPPPRDRPGGALS
jgi:hypothetical protein